MSGNSNTPNTYDSRFFTGDRDEFGMHVFSDPSAQATYDFYEDGYRKKIVIKEAFDKQELLHRMRVDTRREYMTRKGQIKTLQKYAAVEFRNAEMSLQLHYASVQGTQHEYRHRGIDITAPLVSQITLSSGEVVDLKTFDRFAEFERIVGVHASLLQEQKDAEDDEDTEGDDEWDAMMERRLQNRTPYAEGDEDTEGDDEWLDHHCLTHGEWDAMMERRSQNRTRTLNFEWVSCESPTTATATATATTQRSAFGGCYDYTEEELAEQRRDQEIQTRELGQHFVNKWVQLGLRRSLTDEEIAILVAGERAEIEIHAHDYDPSWDYTLNVPAFQEAMRLDELLRQEQIHDVESFTQVLEDCADEALQCDIEQRALELPDEPASEGNIAIPLPLVKAKKQHTATASATKARIAKQMRKNQEQQQKRKFVPITITINDNHATHKQSEALLEMISSSKVEINLPKKNLQKVSREAKKRHTKMWHSINAHAKQSAARGTRIADIPRKRSYLDHDDSDCDGDN